jgi:hypothetical protein
MTPSGTFICDEGCGKHFTTKSSLIRHKRNGCKGNILECKNCRKIFKTPHSRWKHEQYVECERYVSPEERIKELEERLKIVEGQKQQPQTMIQNNYNNTYNITYSKNTGVLTCDNPELEQSEMLCIEGFKRESYYGKVNIDMEILKVVTMGVINDGEYDKFFKFIFRDDTNRRLHFMSLGKNVGATHCDTFERGKIEKIEKEDLFNRVMGYLTCWLSGIDSRYSLMSNLLFTKRSKACFENTLREPSEHFTMFLEG